MDICLLLIIIVAIYTYEGEINKKKTMRTLLCNLNSLLLLLNVQNVFETNRKRKRVKPCHVKYICIHLLIWPRSYIRMDSITVKEQPYRIYLMHKMHLFFSFYIATTFIQKKKELNFNLWTTGMIDMFDIFVLS